MRLFFALWPDDALRRRLAVHRQGAGRPVPPENLHVTLVFLGAVSAEQRTAVEAAAGAAVAAPFRLRLDRFGHFRRSRVTWLGTSVPPPALLALQRQLAAAAGAAGIAVEDRAYAPHLTLAREVATAAARDIEPIEWDVTDFCLVESVTRPQGASYTVRRRWFLQPFAVGADGPDVG